MKTNFALVILVILLSIGLCIKVYTDEKNTKVYDMPSKTEQVLVHGDNDVEDERFYADIETFNKDNGMFLEVETAKDNAFLKGFTNKRVQYTY